MATFLSYYKLIRALPATQMSMITLIFPVVAVVLGWIVLGEGLNANAGLGIALIMGGVGLTLARRQTTTKPLYPSDKAAFSRSRRSEACDALCLRAAAACARWMADRTSAFSIKA